MRLLGLLGEAEEKFFSLIYNLFGFGLFLLSLSRFDQLITLFGFELGHDFVAD